MISAGTRLAQYEVIRPLGSGGMGDVYHARDVRLERDVAVKVMSRQVADNPALRQRFETEARAVAALSHPSIISIYELGISEGVPFAVMELLQGETLRQRILRGPLPWRDAVTIAAATAEGLAAAHVKGVIHRDLKPENVFLTSDGGVKILDFGLARHRLEETGALAVTAAPTAAGVVLGTFGYMAPEQVTGDQIDGRTDIFAAGCVLFEMVSGRRLFGGATPQEVIASLLRTTPPDLSGAIEGTPPEFQRIIARCVQRKPIDRFLSAADLALALRGLLTGSASQQTGHRARPRGKSVAVLPLLNTSGDPQIDYLTDGITESIINSLSQLPGLRVVPRSLAFRYKGVQVDPGTAGLALNVRTILTGRVVTQGEVLDIQAELVDTASESQLWGERFRRRLDEVVTLQEEIAWQISEALRLKLTGEHKRKLRKRAAVDPQAYQEYLRGRHFWHNWGPENFQRAIEHFTRALAHDPGYALAYAGMGIVFAAMSYYGYMSPDDGFPRARTAALKALELDQRLADAHVTLGFERLFYGWDWPAAEASINRALELDPSSAFAHNAHSIFLMSTARFDAALEAARRARALDPLSPFINMGVAWAYHFSGRYEEAIREAKDILTLSPSFEEAGNILVMAYEMLGRLEEAAHVMMRQRYWGATLDGAALLAALQSGDDRAYWSERIRQMVAVADAPPAFNAALATAYSVTRQPDRAIDHLERLVEAHAGGAVFIGSDATLGSLRGTPRYVALVKRVGSPAAQGFSTA